MATSSDLKAKLVVEAQAEGQGEIEALAGELESLAREGGDAAPKLTALAQSLRDLGSQDKVVADFAALRRQTADTAAAMDAATTRVDALGRELEQSAQAARLAATAQDESARQLQAARERQAQLKDAVAQTRTELQAARGAYRQGAADSVYYAEQISDGAAQLKVMQAEQKRAAAEVRELASAHKAAAADSRAAAEAEKATAAQYQAAVQGAAQLSSTLRQQNQDLAGARQALDAAGLSTKGLSDQQAELRAQLVQAQRQAADYVDVVHTMRTEASALGPALQATFKQLGMRGVAQITAEIEQLQAAMRGLKGQKLLPEDAARLSAELQRRIEGLRGDMKGVQTDAKGAAGAVGELGNRSESAGKQIGAAAHKAVAWTGALVGLNELKSVAEKVLETGSAFEQLERRLTGILGSSEKAAQAMGMIKQLAQDTPFDVQGLTETFAKLSAFGLQPTRQQMLAIIDTAAKLGGGTEALTGVSLALGQAWTKQKLQGEEILQLAERGVPVWDLLTKATGRNVQELQKMSEAGQLGRDVILQLIDAMGQQNAGASADLMASYAGAVQRAQDALQEFFNLIAQSGVLDYLTKQLNGLLAQFDALKASGELDAWAKRIATGFIDVANTAQALIGIVKLLAPAIEVAIKMMVVSKVMSFAGSLTSVAKGAGEVAAGMDKMALASRAGLAVFALAAIQTAQSWYGVAKAYGAYRAELAKHEAMNAQVAQKQDQVAAKLKAISDATGVVVTSMKELEAAEASGALVFDQASAKYLSAAQAQQQLAGAVKATAGELAAVDASRIVAEFEKANAAAGETDKAIGKLAESLKFKDVQGASAFVLAMQQIGVAGALSARQVGEAWQQALGKLSAGELGALRANLEEAARTGIISAQALAQANDQVLTASFARLGVNAAQALGKVSAGAQEAIDSVGLVADAAAAAGVKSAESARAIEMAFAAAVPKADSLQAVEALEHQLQALGNAGKISADGIKRTQEALDKQRATIEDQLPGIQSLGEALRQLGVKPKAELQALARQSKEAFDFIRNSGTASADEINQAWRAMAESQIEANDGVADGMLQAQAGMHGFAIKTDEAGKAVVESMKKAEDATHAVGAATEKAAEQQSAYAKRLAEAAELAAWKYGKVGEEAEKAGDKGAEAADKTREAHERAGKAIEFTWLSAAAQASKYRDEAARHAEEMGRKLGLYMGPGMSWQMYIGGWNAYYGELRRLSEEYANSLERLDARQQALADRNSGAARGVEDLRMRLLELNGTEEEIAQARSRREAAEIERQIQLAQIELERASVRGDTAALQRYTEEVEQLREQVSLLGQIEQAEKRKRKERADQGSAGGDRGGGSGSGSGGAGGGVSSSPSNFNVTLNANGVNDPVKLARMIEPELKKMARLAR